MPARKVSLDGNNEPVKKPGLASLMPDKTPKALSERTKAVKRMYKESKPEKPKANRAKAAPKTVVKSPSKVTVRTRNTKKIPEIIATPKAPRTSGRAKATEGIIIESKVDAMVTLPDRVSVRAQEKALAILSTLTKDFKQSAERISYVSGFCFVLFGSYLALSFSGAMPQVLIPQAAQLLTGTTDPATSTLTNTTTQMQLQSFPKPTFSLLDPLPPVIDSVSKHTIEVTNAELIDASLFSLATGERFDVSSEKVVDKTFRLTVDPSSLKPARYVLKVTLESSYDNSKYVFKVGEFEVPLPPTDVSLQAETNAMTTESSGGTGVADDATETDTETEQAETVETEITEEVELEKEVEKLVVTTSGAVLGGRSIIKVAAPSGARTIELFVRPLKSSTKRFVGLAERHNGLWQYFFDTTDVPNGEYEIVARTKVDGSFIEASSARIMIANFVPSPIAPENPTPDEVVAIEPEVEIDPSNGRSFSEVSLYSVAPDVAVTESASTTQFETTSDIDSIIALYRSELESILERYAVARQSEDQLMLELVERELVETRQKMVTDVLLDPTLNDLGDDVDTVLTERFYDIKRRIDTFEELRRTATERASAIDRDGDGISDFDETNLYQTDPDKSDTDNDGVIDGIEIMRGYDPLDPAAEVIISYEMPQDTIGLVEDELLRIEDVSPVIKTDDPTVAPLVQAEIRGKGLPNSFVTIYIFSTPTIVTVRTGEDGSFVYTFEKELEDGEHEVYVAVTDNAGTIMAKSNPFRFVKQAEAFSPISGATALPTDNSLVGTEILGSYNIAIGLGILAFGIILLMLGATLRERQGFLMTSPKHDVAAS